MAKQLIYQFDIGGQARTLNFGMYCWELFCERMDIGPSDIMSVFRGGKTFKSMRNVVYCGIVANDFLHDIPNSVTEAEITKWLNDSPDIMGSIFTVAMNVFFDMGKKDQKPEPDQKKSRSHSTASKK